jgi:hypothetical protein
LLFISNTYSTCPPAKDLLPCVCIKEQESILIKEEFSLRCEGSSIVNLKTEFWDQFDYLYIKNTSIEKLRDFGFSFVHSNKSIFKIMLFFQICHYSIAGEILPENLLWKIILNSMKTIFSSWQRIYILIIKYNILLFD